jgi:transposase-like protein
MNKEITTSEKKSQYIFPKYFCDTCGSDSVEKNSSCFENNVIWCKRCKCHRYMSYKSKTLHLIDK